MEESTENLKISQKFGMSRQILGKICVQQCESLHCLKDISISFYFLFLCFMKNFVLFLNYVNVKISPWK